MKSNIVAIAGGSASGKSSIVKTIQKKLKDKMALITMDAYYKSFDELSFEERLKLNFDHPDSFEIDRFYRDLKRLKEGETIEIPIYDYVKYTRLQETVTIEPKPLIVVEGLMVLWDHELRTLFDLKVFVDVDSDERLSRRIRRDIVKRGRDVESVLDQYESQVKPMHEQFIEPSKKYADIIIPRGAHNKKGMKLLLDHLKKKAK